MGRSGKDPVAVRTSASPDPAEQSGRGHRAAGIALVAVLAMGLIAAAVWGVTVLLADPLPDRVRMAEYETLDARLKAVDAAITPIALAFTSEPASSSIDIGAYRDKVASARAVVDGVNGVEVSGADALRIRDLIVTGGSQVVSGMNMALDAAQSDEASAATPAFVQVEEGLSALQEARRLLDDLLGRTSLTEGLREIGTPVT